MSPTIPCYQTLGPGTGWRLWKNPLPFPLGHPRTREYYLGRAAVYHGAKALGLKPGDEVLFPAYHSGTESAPLMHLGCRLVFYGVRRDLSLDLDEIEAKITPRTTAIYAIHFIGFPAPIQELRKLADRRGLALIEDVALGFPGQLDGQPLGSWGDIGIFCLYKSLPVAHGGMLVVNRGDVPLPPPVTRGNLYSELNLTAKHVLDHLELFGGRLGGWIRRTVQRLGRAGVTSAGLQIQSPNSLLFEPHTLDYRMGRLTRRLLRLLDYEHVARQRRANYRRLADGLHGSGVQVLRPELVDGMVPLFFPVLVEDKLGTVERLHREGIDAIVFWGIHHPHVPRGEFPDVEFLVDHAIEIPVHQSLCEPHLARIRDALLRCARWEACPVADEACACAAQ